MNSFTDDEWKKKIEQVWLESGQGNIYKAVGNTYWGINHRGTGSPVPSNHDQHGLTFFTRPNLNLSYNNIVNERIFLPLLDKRPDSMFRAIRLYLDYDAHDVFGSRDYNPASTPLKSSLVNPKMAFIPLLANNLLSMSGWPDIALDTYTSKEGRAREAWSMGDGITRNFQTLSMSASFRNMIGDPITLMFFYWVNYISLVYQGKISPKPECIVENEIDYMTRIYRLILDPSRKYVRKISACGAAFPISDPIGASHNFAIEQPINKENDQVTINFQMIGIEYLDPILITEFNRTVSLFNPDFKTDKYDGNPFEIKNSAPYVKLDNEDLNTFNNNGYPWINPLTYELEWYIEKATYEAVVGKPKQAPVVPQPTVKPPPASIAAPHPPKATPAQQQDPPAKQISDIPGFSISLDEMSKNSLANSDPEPTPPLIAAQTPRAPN